MITRIIMKSWSEEVKVTRRDAGIISPFVGILRQRIELALRCNYAE
jgi:hypothetical protein